MSLEDTSGRNVLSHYGPRAIKSNYGGENGTKGRTKTAVWVVDWADLNVDFATADLGANALAYVIPAGAVINSAVINVTTAFDGTVQTMSVGLENSAGTAIDADGLAAVANVTVLGSIVGAGALVGATIGEADGYLAIVGAAADSTVGEAEIIVEYTY